jgi:hypothetical protein
MKQGRNDFIIHQDYGILKNNQPISGLNSAGYADSGEREGWDQDLMHLRICPLRLMS